MTTDRRAGLEIDELTVADGGKRPLVSRFSLSCAPGSMHVVLGESGAGKSLICRAIAGTLPPDVQCTGRVALDGDDLFAMSQRRRRATWSRDIFLLPQEPWFALASARSLVSQVADMPRLHRGETRRDARASARALLSRFGIVEAADQNKRPHELSGGMAQRASVATAIGAPARLILVDEPTKGLDAERRQDVADALKLLVEEGRAVLVVTHDLTLASLLGGTTTIIRSGAIVERGPTQSVLSEPKSAYGRALVDADPPRWTDLAWDACGERVAGLSDVNIRIGKHGPLIAQALTIDVRATSIVGLTGPSGSGKTTIGDTILKLRAPSAGAVHWSSHRRKAYQKLYQNPGSAFAPWRTLEATVRDALSDRRQAALFEARLESLLHDVGLPREILARLPHQISGGELQRIGLIRCLLCDPVFIFADEPTSRLDALSQKKVMQVMKDAVLDQGLGVLLVSHDKTLVHKMTSHSIDFGEGPFGRAP